MVEVLMLDGTARAVSGPEVVGGEVSLTRATILIDGVEYVTAWESADLLRSAIAAKLERSGPARGDAALALCGDPEQFARELARGGRG